MKSRCGRENSLSAAPVPSGIPVRRTPASANAAAGISRKKRFGTVDYPFYLCLCNDAGFWPLRARLLIFYVFCFLERRAGRHFRKIIEFMAKETIYLTAEGYKKLKDELDHMRSVERPAISAAIAEARDKGDLSENAEYDAAREAQGLLEMRIAKLEDTIANARIIDESKIDKSKVQILSKVTLLNHNNNKQMTDTIVAEHEANLREGKLAIGTPIAKALLGHRKGDRVDVDVPAGTIHFEILDISI